MNTPRVYEHLDDMTCMQQCWRSRRRDLRLCVQTVMAWNHDGSLLASASQKGTVIRVFRLPDVSKAYTFRRGTTTSTIHSLAFSPPSVKPSLLCAASAHGTVHLFHLQEAVG